MDEINRMLIRLRQEDLARDVVRRQRVRDALAASDPTARLGLSRELHLVVLGIFVNYVGYGAVLPFEVIYLHDGRGFSLGVAGLVVALVTGAAILTAAPVGPVVDRFGARAVAAGGAVALAAGYTALAFARFPGIAFVAAAIAGAGNGALNPAQSTLIATLSPPALRHRATAVSRVAANVGAGIGGGVGGVVATYGLTGFVGLLLANAITYLLFVGVLIAVVRGGGRPEAIAGGYRLVLRDRAFVSLAVINVAMVAVGWGAFTWLVPPYAGNELGISAPLIGLLLLANAGTVAIVQLPVARLAEGHRRVVMVALAAGTFVAACVLVVAASAGGRHTYEALFAATILVGVGECLHTTVLMPLTADLAPAGLRGRYMASMGLSWWIGLALAPVLGARFLDGSSTAVFLTAATVATAAGVAAMTLDHRLPRNARLTPRRWVRTER